MISRILTNAGAPFFFPNGQIAARIKITFTLVKNTGLAHDIFDGSTGERIAPGPIVAVTDDAGVFSVPLWPTSRGDTQSFYLCHVPLNGVEDIIAPLPDEAGDYTWMQFRDGAIGYDAGDWVPTPLEMLDVSAWPSLADAIADPLTFGKTLWISTTVSCDDLDTTGRDIRVLLGGMITVNPGCTLICPLLEAGDYRIFAGAGFVSGLKKAKVVWFGALGNGISDDRPSFSAAFRSSPIVSANDGQYLFSSSETADAVAGRMVTIYPGQEFSGNGVTTQIKIANGSLGLRNVFSIDPTVATDYDLGTITFKDFYADLNGDNNARVNAGATARNNALIKVFYFRHLLVENVMADNAPGNQIIWAYAPTLIETRSSATVRDCKFYRVGNDIAGNYNADHSTSFLTAHTVRQYNNTFTKTSLTTSETAMELHGEYTYCEDNTVVNYNRMSHVVADLSVPMQLSVVSGNSASTRVAAVTYWTDSGGAQDIREIQVINNTFSGYGGASFTGLDMETHVANGSVLKANVDGNTFKNITFGSEAAAIYTSALVKNLSVIDNLFDTLNWHAVNSKVSSSLIVEGNTFNECAKAGAGDPIVKVMATCKRVTIESNHFYQSNYFSENTIWIEGQVERGYITGNNFHTWFDDWPIYFTGAGLTSVSFLVDIEIYLATIAVPDADVYASKGSKLKNLNGGNEYFRSTTNFGNTWSQFFTEFYFGSGTPEGTVTGRVGSLYLNSAGGASTTLYVKTSGTGNTGWTAK